MTRLRFIAATAAISALGSALALAADNRQEKRLTVAPGAVINIVNNAGMVNLHGGSGQQVVVTSTTHSDSVNVAPTVTADGRRVEISVQSASGQKLTDDDAKVDLDVTVPAGVSVVVRTATASVMAEGLNGDLSASSDTGQITLKNVSKAHIHIRGVAAPVSLANVKGGDVDITAAGGNVDMVNVTGHKVTVGTTSGNIGFQGDVSGGGDYTFTSHSGGIDLTIPESASFELDARAVRGTVENDFPLVQKSHAQYPQTTGGRSFSGTSHSGSSSVQVQSFSGRIRVKKQ